MSVIAIVLGLFCQVCNVSGQLLFKRAMNPVKAHSRNKMMILMGIGIATQALWFFLWVGLLEKWDVSRLYVFEGMGPALLAVAAGVFLKEKLPLVAWLGLFLICLGIGIVSSG